MHDDNIQSHSPAWLFYVKTAFVLSLVAMGTGILFMPLDLTIQGYFALCAVFMVSSTITLTKTLRDDHESQRLINKLNEARAKKVINEFAE